MRLFAKELQVIIVNDRFSNRPNHFNSVEKPFIERNPKP